MSVAPSFQNFEFLCEPYEVSGKMYIRVRNPKTGTERQVRWYDEKKPAAATKVAAPKLNDPYYKSQKEVLGFTRGYITIFKGDTYSCLKWFQQSIARYCKLWGWYIISTEDIPTDLPEGVEPIRLEWDSVGNDDGKLKRDSDVVAAVDALMYEPGISEYVGAIGERLELTLTITRAIELDNDFGHSTMHIMEDDCGNVFVWTTSAKTWAEGSVKTIRGTVKDHRIYKNTKQTVLNRCVER